MTNVLFKFLVILLHLCTGVLFLSPGHSFAQGLINNGAYLVLTNTSNVYIDGTTGHFTNQSGGQITNSTTGGTVTVGGNWINNAANTVFSNDGATTVFNSASAQSIAGSGGTGFYNITASGAGIKTFSTASTVSRLVSVGASSTINANGKLTLLADATSNASVGPLLSGASVTNNVLVQSFLTGGSNAYRAFKGLSSPINDALVVGNKTYKQLQSKLIITGPGGTANGFDKGNSVSPNAVTIKTYNEAAALSASQFTNLPNITQSTVPGNGFFLFYRGDRAINYNASGTYATGAKIVGPNYTTPENVTVTYTGPINQGNISVALTYTNNGDGDIYRGMRLVGNPYPSVIDWHAVKSSSNSNDAQLSPNIYIIRQDGSFVTYNSTTGVGQDNATRYIMPGQAFYVKANTTSQNINFTESCKVPYPSPGSVMRFLSAPGASKALTMGAGFEPAKVSADLKVLKFYLSNGVQEDTKDAVLVFSNQYSADFEPENDAPYFSGGSLILCSQSNDEKNLALNFLPEPSASTEIKLYVGASNTGNLSLAFPDLSSLAGAQLFVQDNYLNKTVNVSSQSSYDFTIDSNNPATFGPNRLKLIFRPIVTSFELSAKKVYGGSEIKWKDNTKAASKYLIERSEDGNAFEVIGSTAPNDGSTFLDTKPGPGTNYYRLKLIEDNDRFSYTNSVSLKYEEDLTEPYFKIYPNPVADVLNVSFKQEVEKTVLHIYNLNGQKLKSASVSHSGKISLNVNELPPGVYVIKAVNNRNHEVATEKFIKE